MRGFIFYWACVCTVWEVCLHKEVKSLLRAGSIGTISALEEAYFPSFASSEDCIKSADFFNTLCIRAKLLPCLFFAISDFCFVDPAEGLV